MPLGIGAKEALGVLAGMVLLLATGAVPPAVAALLAAGTLIILRVISIDHAYRAISGTTVILVAGMIPLSTAMQATGAAGQLADGLIRIVGDAGPHALLPGLFVLIAVLGQLISNTATALIVIPIALTSAAELGVSARPVLLAVNVAATAALLTPIATPANLWSWSPADTDSVTTGSSDYPSWAGTPSSRSSSSPKSGNSDRPSPKGDHGHVASVDSNAGRTWLDPNAAECERNKPLARIDPALRCGPTAASRNPVTNPAIRDGSRSRRRRAVGDATPSPCRARA